MDPELLKLYGKRGGKGRALKAHNEKSAQTPEELEAEIKQIDKEIEARKKELEKKAREDSVKDEGSTTSKSKVKAEGSGTSKAKATKRTKAKRARDDSAEAEGSTASKSKALKTSSKGDKDFEFTPSKDEPLTPTIMTSVEWEKKGQSKIPVVIQARDGRVFQLWVAQEGEEAKKRIWPLLRERIQEVGKALEDEVPGYDLPKGPKAQRLLAHLFPRISNSQGLRYMPPGASETKIPKSQYMAYLKDMLNNITALIADAKADLAKVSVGNPLNVFTVAEELPLAQFREKTPGMIKLSEHIDILNGQLAFIAQAIDGYRKEFLAEGIVVSNALDKVREKYDDLKVLSIAIADILVQVPEAKGFDKKDVGVVEQVPEAKGFDKKDAGVVEQVPESKGSKKEDAGEEADLDEVFGATVDEILNETTPEHPSKVELAHRSDEELSPAFMLPDIVIEELTEGGHACICKLCNPEYEERLVSGIQAREEAKAKERFLQGLGREEETRLRIQCRNEHKARIYEEERARILHEVREGLYEQAFEAKYSEANALALRKHKQDLDESYRRRYEDSLRRALNPFQSSPAGS